MMSNKTRGKKEQKEVVKENILRVMMEEMSNSEDIEKIRKLVKEPIVPGSWETDLGEYFTDALIDLQENGLVTISKNKISITKDGQIEATIIFSKHKVIEKFFLKDLNISEAHKAADILEHLISTEVIENMNRINSLEENGVGLNKFTSNEGIITKLKIDDTQLFERMISMGICPSQRIKIIAKVASGFIVKLKHTQIAIDNSLLNGILVAML